MPKRSFDEKMKYYLQKMELLRDKHRRKRQRVESYPSEYEDEDSYYANYYNNNQEDETAMWRPAEPDIVEEPEPPLPDVGETGGTDAPFSEAVHTDAQQELAMITSQGDPPPQPLAVTQAPAPSLPATADTAAAAPPPLDPAILSALGEATDSGPKWGQEIHTHLCQLWLPLLKKGMEKETKDKILKQYLVPSNCTLLQAPKLNIEISAAVAEMVRLRDKKVENSQQQLGIGVTAISRAMSLLLESDNKIEAIKMLSDGCRILCDLHYTETQARIKMITPGLAKSFLNVIQESERDETLFGCSLPDKIKASKTIEKQGLQIKKSLPPSRPTPTAPNTSTTRQQFQGNWAGSPRYPMNRGGRGGQRRSPMPARRPAPVTSTQTRPGQNKTRAPPRP